MFRYNPKANYQPNEGRYLQILSCKDLYKQTIVLSAGTHDTFLKDFQIFMLIILWGKCLQGLCFPTFQNVGKYRYGYQGNQVSIFRRSVLTYITSLASFNLISQEKTELLQGLCFLTF